MFLLQVPSKQEQHTIVAQQKLSLRLLFDQIQVLFTVRELSVREATLLGQCCGSAVPVGSVLGGWILHFRLPRPVLSRQQQEVDSNGQVSSRDPVRFPDSPEHECQPVHCSVRPANQHLQRKGLRGHLVLVGHGCRDNFVVPVWVAVGRGHLSERLQLRRRKPRNIWLLSSRGQSGISKFEDLFQFLPRQGWTIRPQIGFGKCRRAGGGRDSLLPLDELWTQLPQEDNEEKLLGDLQAF